MTKTLAPALLAAAALMLLCACGGGAEKAAPAPAPSDRSSGALSSDELKVKLAAGDKVDGTEDHVISLCSGCRLGMSGKAEHAISAEGYELHMCSAACKAHFEEDFNASMAALEIPQS